MSKTLTQAVNPTRHRYVVMVMIFVCVVITYLDRSNISITAPVMRSELGIDTVHMGWILSAFGWTYAFCQIPGGWLVDRIRPRYFYPAILVLWSVATACLGWVGSFVALFALRLLIGALEAPSYSINNQVVTSWFPDRERAGAIGFYTSGQFIGLAFLQPLLVWLVAEHGWRTVFFTTGIGGMFWGLIWWLAYRSPRESGRTNEAEFALIETGGGLVDLGSAEANKQRRKLDWADLGTVFKYRKLWGVYIGQFAVTSCQWFFLTWFPTYLVEFRHLSILKSGIYVSLPFIAAFFGTQLGGFLSDRILRSGKSLGLARKTPIIFGLLLSSSIVGANFVDAPELVIAFMALAFFGNGMASIGWSLISHVAPRHLIGLTGGTFNFISNLSGITTPLVIGYLAKNGNFAPGLTYIATVAVIGALTYIFVIGKLERVE
ncbi:MAG TPA: MFS transporter [Rhizomicrobium sp.]|nr:MFS transporter [Rhizomicrobium sp.]